MSIPRLPTLDPYWAALEAQVARARFDALACAASAPVLDAQYATYEAVSRPLLSVPRVPRIAGRSIAITPRTWLDAHIDVLEVRVYCVACVAAFVIDRFEAKKAELEANREEGTTMVTILDAKTAALHPNIAALLEKIEAEFTRVARFDANLAVILVATCALHVHVSESTE